MIFFFFFGLKVSVVDLLSPLVFLPRKTVSLCSPVLIPRWTGRKKRHSLAFHKKSRENNSPGSARQMSVDERRRAGAAEAAAPLAPLRGAKFLVADATAVNALAVVAAGL